MVRKHLIHPRRFFCNQDDMEESNFSRKNLELTGLPRSNLVDLSGLARPDSMARILVNSSKTNTSSTSSIKNETSAATVTRRILPNPNSGLPICEIRMTSKLKSLLLEGHKRDQDDGERRMMPPPPPPAPRPLPQLLKLSNSFSTDNFDCSSDEFVKSEPDCFGLGSGSELELLAEAAIATDPREEDFYDSNLDLEEKDLVVNLGRILFRFYFTHIFQSFWGSLITAKIHFTYQK